MILYDQWDWIKPTLTVIAFHQDVSMKTFVANICKNNLYPNFSLNPVLFSPGKSENQDYPDSTRNGSLRLYDSTDYGYSGGDPSYLSNFSCAFFENSIHLRKQSVPPP